MTSRAIPYFCWDCKVKFTVYWTPGKKPFCPKCGDRVAVKRNPYLAEINPETKGSRPVWTEQEDERLIHLYTTTNLTCSEMALEFSGRTFRGIKQRLWRLREKGKV